jgi:hypothetical protein
MGPHPLRPRGGGDRARRAASGGAPSDRGVNVQSRGDCGAPARPLRVAQRPGRRRVGVLGSSYRGAPCRDRWVAPCVGGESEGGAQRRAGAAGRPPCRWLWGTRRSGAPVSTEGAPPLCSEPPRR